MAYTADIGAKGATVKEVRKAIELLDTKFSSIGLEDAPSDGKVYVRVNGAWAVVTNATVTTK